MTGWPDRPRALVSYAYITTPALPDPLPTWDILIDSGAFTAYTSGKTIDRAAYTDWLAANAGRYTAAFALDVIGDPTASLANYEWQRSALRGTGVTLIPTWHMGAPWDVLESMCQTAGYVSIGGMVPYFRRRPLLMRNCIRAHQIARNHGVRLHGLGASGSTVRQLPWYSVDSSSWAMPRRQPVVYVADQHGTMRTIQRGNGKDARRHASTLRRYGLNPTEYATYGSSTAKRVGKDEARSRTDRAVVASARSYMWSEAANPTGTLIYLATSPGATGPIGQAWADGPPYPRAHRTTSAPPGDDQAKAHNSDQGADE